MIYLFLDLDLKVSHTLERGKAGSQLLDAGLRYLVLRVQLISQTESVGQLEVRKLRVVSSLEITALEIEYLVFETLHKMEKQNVKVSILYCIYIT